MVSIYWNIASLFWRSNSAGDKSPACLLQDITAPRNTIYTACDLRFFMTIKSSRYEVVSEEPATSNSMLARDHINLQETL